MPLIEKSWADYLALGILCADLEQIRTGYTLARILRKLAANKKHEKKCIRRVFEVYGARALTGEAADTRASLLG